MSHANNTMASQSASRMTHIDFASRAAAETTPVLNALCMASETPTRNGRVDLVLAD